MSFMIPLLSLRKKDSDFSIPLYGHIRNFIGRSVFKNGEDKSQIRRLSKQIGYIVGETDDCESYVVFFHTHISSIHSHIFYLRPLEFELLKRVFLKRSSSNEFVEHKKQSTIQVRLGDVLRFTRDEPFIEYEISMPRGSTPLSERKRRKEEEERPTKRRRIIEFGGVENTVVPFDAFLGMDVMKAKLTPQHCKDIRKALLVSGAVRETDSHLVLNDTHKRYLENLTNRSPWLVLTEKMRKTLGITTSERMNSDRDGRMYIFFL